MVTSEIYINVIRAGIRKLIIATSLGSFRTVLLRYILSGILEHFELDLTADQNFFVMVFGDKSSSKFYRILALIRFLSFFRKEENFL